ncbi:MAG TPA: ABC transporter permease [Candidatus Acidoferrum sp.]|nr:ABC transporter permease [Candidatus Acidoferrum sp.]
MHHFWQDVRASIRRLRNAPGSAIAAILLLAVGISVNSTLFSLIDGFLLRPLPVKDADQLVGISAWPHGSSSYADYEEICRQNTTFEGIAVVARHVALLRTNSQTQLIKADFVSANYFSVLGVVPIRGRPFMNAEETSNQPTAVISYGLWQRQFAADPEIIGKQAWFTGKNTLIVGVAPPQFYGLQRGFWTDVWFAAKTFQSRESLAQRDYRDYELVGRLRPGAQLSQARAEFDTIAQRLSASFPDADKGLRLLLDPETEHSRGRLILSVLLLTAVALVLVICCANVAGMALAKMEGMRQEIAVRLALGAGRLRLMSELLAENIILALTGGALALLLTFWLIRLQPALMPPMTFAMRFDVRVDHRVFLFTLLASFAAAFFSGFFPALRASKTDLVSALKGNDESPAGRTLGVIPRNALVVSQIALSVILMAAAGLLAKSLLLVEQINPGFNTKANLLTIMVAPLQGHSESVPLFYAPLMAKLKGLPGIRRASYASVMPFSGSGGGATRKVFLPGVEMPPGQESLDVHFNAVGPDYFRTIGTRILRGRDFTSADETGHLHSALINSTMARSFWPDRNPIGQHVKVENADCEIVGIVEDVKNESIHEPDEPYMYFPFAQMPSSDVTILVESAGAPETVMDAAKHEIIALDKNVIFVNVKTLRQLLESALWGDRMPAFAAAVLAGIGMFLAVIGLYGVTAYLMKRRTREIAVRMALGAQRGQVVRLVLLGSSKLALIGIALGLASAFGVCRILSNVLYGVKPSDPAVYALCALVVFTVALLASYIPARRAMRVDPMVALRYE